MKRKDSFANRVRQALKRQALISEEGKVTNAALAEHLDLVGDRDKRPLYGVLNDLRKTGEIERVSPGVHIYKGKSETGPDIRSAMWAVLRMRGRVSIDDLQELAGASATYAIEYMAMLVRRGAVERIGKGGKKTVYQLVKDTGPRTPENDEAAAKLRRLRQAKKAAMDGLNEAGRALIDATRKLVAARIAVADIDEEVDHGDN